MPALALRVVTLCMFLCTNALSPSSIIWYYRGQRYCGAEKEVIRLASADLRHLRSTNCQLLAVPRYRLNTYGSRTFSVAEFHPGPDHQFGLFQTAT